jgi:hypothetical protein
VRSRGWVLRSASGGSLGTLHTGHLWREPTTGEFRAKGSNLGYGGQSAACCRYTSPGWKGAN